MEKTLQQQYTLIREGKGNKDHFLKSARRVFPEFITPNTDYNTAVHILKGKSILSEGVGGIATLNPIKPDWFKIFDTNLKEAIGVKNTKEYGDQNEFEKIDKETEETLNHQFDNKDDKNIDNVYGQSFLMGYYTEMKDPKNEGKTVDELKAIVAKNMAKDINYYHTEASFGVKGIGYTSEAPGAGIPKEPKGKYKSSGYGDMPKVVKEGQDKNQDIHKVATTMQIKAFDSLEEKYGDDVVNSFWDKNEDRIDTMTAKLLRSKLTPEEKQQQLFLFIDNQIIKPNLKEGQDKNQDIHKVATTMQIKAFDSLEEKYGDDVVNSFWDKNEDRIDTMTAKLLRSKLTPEEKQQQLFLFIDNQIIKPNLKENLSEAKEEIKVGDIIGNTVQGFNFKVKEIKNNTYIVQNTKTDKTIETVKSNMYKSGTRMNEAKKRPAISTEIKEIEKTNEVLALEAKMKSIDEAIEKRQDKLKLAESEELAELVNPDMVKTLQKEIKELEKYKAKASKMYEKMTGSAKKEVIDEEENIMPTY
jgi:predicted ArsR family transcriptional regulator